MLCDVGTMMGLLTSVYRTVGRYMSFSYAGSASDYGKTGHNKRIKINAGGLYEVR